MLSANSNNDDSRPLVVDLDGTLLHTDLLLESGLSFLKNHPIHFLRPLIWLCSGKIKLKSMLAASTDIDVKVLPYNNKILALISDAKANGRKVVLATASHHVLAERVAKHLQLFDEVIATTSEVNLSAHKKRSALIETYGERNFDYVGNSADDLKVWPSAHKAYVVNPNIGVERKAKAIGNVAEVIYGDKVSIRTWVKALRIHQWLKNFLVFVPLLTAHQFTNLETLIPALWAFLFFGMCASSVYILNDLLDLSDDRNHHTKKNRPFASGKISLKLGILAFPILLLAAFSGASILLPLEFSIALGLYYLLTFAYSIKLKQRMSVDVITLALLYTIRIVAGAAACGLDLTFWILAFSMFIFLSLALVKRYAELLAARNKGQMQKSRGRGYSPNDLEMLASLGASSGYLSVMVLALYIQDQAARSLYNHPEFIWLACPIMLFWITRIWMVTHRGEMNDDPVVYAAKDKISLITGVLFALVFWMAT